MTRLFFGLFASLFAASALLHADPKVPVAPEALASAVIEQARNIVVVIPLRAQIADPELFILRRGLKTAIEQKASAIVLDMDTPGGWSDTMLSMMETLDNYEGLKITFVNTTAGSAGALIAGVTNHIYLAPRGVIGAAEAVDSSGREISEALKRKINSFMSAKIRSYTDTNPLRAQVLQAMMDPDYELKLGDKVINPKGKLLTLTAKEATALYGEPPQPLLAKGIAKTVDELLTAEFGAGNYTITRLEVTWAERAAQYLTEIKPILLGLGLLALFIEFKTPGFGLFGISGIVLLGLVFISSYVAGFSGHEPMLLFVVGLGLVAVEIFFFPGVVLPALLGLALMCGSLVWAMADLWPNQPISITGPAADVFVRPLQNLGLGVLFAAVLGIALLRFLPRGWFMDKMILASSIHSAAQTSGAAPENTLTLDQLIGREGVATTGLFPSGQVEIDGQIHEARIEIGSVNRGERVIVRARSGFGLVVEKLSAQA